MPENYEKLETFLTDNDVEHTHITDLQVTELYRASKNVENSDLILKAQKIVLCCRMCSVLLAECSPTYYGSAHITGFRGVTPTSTVS